MFNFKIRKFARRQGYKGAKYLCKWNEYKVYEPYMSRFKNSYIGLPLVILKDKNGTIRMSTTEEATNISK